MGNIIVPGVAKFSKLTDIKWARKTSAQTVNNSETLVDVTDLVFSILANEIYYFELFLRIYRDVGGSNTTKLLIFKCPAGCGGYFGGIDGFYTQTVLDGSTPVARAGNASIIQGKYHGWVVNGATAGNIQLQFAQTTAEAFDHKIMENSLIMAYKIN